LPQLSAFRETLPVERPALNRFHRKVGGQNRDSTPLFEGLFYCTPDMY